MQSVTRTLTTTTHNLESLHHDAIHLPGLLHVLSGGLCYHAMLATTVISSPWVGVHLDADETVPPKTDQTSNAIYIYTGILWTSYVSVTSGCWFLFWIRADTYIYINLTQCGEVLERLALRCFYTWLAIHIQGFTIMEYSTDTLHLTKFNNSSHCWTFFCFFPASETPFHWGALTFHAKVPRFETCLTAALPGSPVPMTLMEEMR